MMRILKSGDLQKAAEDFRYLLNKGYPRKAALALVGNRYELSSDQRHLLHRGVFSDRDSLSRKKKKISLKAIRNKDLAIDGYNVIITLEAGQCGRPLVLGDDTFFRDISGLSGSFKKTEKTGKALEWIFDVIKEGKPRHTLFLFDAPISKSGKLAEEVRNRMHQEGIPGDARAINVPEKILIGFQGVVATSDTAIIDQSEEVVDLAGEILKKSGYLESLLRFKKGKLFKKHWTVQN
jgi:hypothetical protein